MSSKFLTDDEIFNEINTLEKKFKSLYKLAPIQEVSKIEQLKRTMIIIEMIAAESDYWYHEIEADSDDPFTFAVLPERNKENLQKMQEVIDLIYRISHAANPHGCESSHPDWNLDVEKHEYIFKKDNIVDVDEVLRDWFRLVEVEV